MFNSTLPPVIVESNPGSQWNLLPNQPAMVWLVVIGLSVFVCLPIAIYRVCKTNPDDLLEMQMDKAEREDEKRKKKRNMKNENGTSIEEDLQETYEISEV